MKTRLVLFVLLLSGMFLLNGCGSGSDGLNGSISLTAAPTGSVVTATASYTNPSTSNLIGVPITFSVRIGTQSFTVGTFNTNNSGSVTVAFPVPAFNGKQTVTVIAGTGNLTDFEAFEMTGRSLAFTAPPSLNLSVSAADTTVGTTRTILLPASPSFIAVTNPFTTDLSGLQFDIQAVATSSAATPPDTFTVNGATPTANATTVTNTGGTASFPGATATLTVPATIGGVTTMTIIWTVTDKTPAPTTPTSPIPTGLTGTGVTTITLTKVP